MTERDEEGGQNNKPRKQHARGSDGGADAPNKRICGWYRTGLELKWRHRGASLKTSGRISFERNVAENFKQESKEWGETGDTKRNVLVRRGLLNFDGGEIMSVRAGKIL